MNNRKLGNNFEAEFCQILSDNGFWAHNMTQNSAGQPADIIAAKYNKSYLIDCKETTSAYRFPFTRIEENQRLAMTRWKATGNDKAYFALRVPDGTIYMLSFWIVLFLERRGKVSLGKKDLEIFCVKTLDDWLEGVEYEHGNS